MSDPLHFCVVEDNAATAKTVELLLADAGHRTTIFASSLEALEKIPQANADAVLLDIMMPQLDGFELCRKLRQFPGLKDVKIIILSAKAYDFDRRRAREMGADNYIVKPIRTETFVAEVMRAVSDEVAVRFWGVRGTLPVPGPGSIKYGGNTSCLTLQFPGGQYFILDAGTGIKRLSDHLMAGRAKRLEGKILISHPHWDHINALPFFIPLYVPGNDFEIVGPSHSDVTMEGLVSAQMDGVYFPITTREFGARIRYRDLPEGAVEIDGISVETMLLAHPGNCLGYRFSYGARSICYITDNELYLPTDEYYSADYVSRLADFVRETDLLITDSTYTDEEYASKVGWGHSCISRVVDLAHRAEVRTLALFHHDPDQDDDAIDAKLASAQDMLADLGSRSECLAPAEDDEISI